jgi:hypothetical protein
VAEGVYTPDQGADQTPGDRYVAFELISGVALKGGYAGCGAFDPDARDIALYETVLSGDLSGNDDPTLRGDSNCCSGVMRDTPGCDNPVCQELVCETSACCDGWWDSSCGSVAEHHCCELCRPTRCENSYHVLTASGVEATAVLDGFTVTGGEANAELDEPPFYRRGGGLFSEAGSPTIESCLFVENYPNAIYTHYGEPRIKGCDFVDNGTYAGGGGYAVKNSSNEAEVTNCRFIRNRGGGLNAWGSKTIVGCSFVENKARGGLYLTYGAPTIWGCSFIHNQTKSNGGGAYNVGGYAQFVNCVFHGNSALYFGGGLRTYPPGVSLINCIFSGNTAGGGVSYPSASPAPGFGGAVEQNGGSMLVLNSTFYGNSAGYAGAMTGGDHADIAQCVFWGNTCTEPDCGWQSPIISQVWGIGYFIEHSWIGGDDPLFVDADGPDGILGTEDDNLRLSVDSPLINYGDPDPPLVPYLDADGHERILCGRVDIGAYEFGIGDYDCDTFVDLLDFAAWNACMTGPDNGPFDAGCEAFDFDASATGDVDLKDFAGFQRTLLAD